MVATLIKVKMIREKMGDGENIERDKRFGIGVFFFFFLVKE